MLKTTLLCLFVSALFVSVSFASRVHFKDSSKKQSRATKYRDFDLNSAGDVLSIRDSVLLEQPKMDPIRRSKKSCGCSGNPYNQRPFMGYSESQYGTYPGDNHYNSPPKSQYHDPRTIYSPSDYNAPNYNVPSYNSPSYNDPNFPSTNGQPTYHQAPFNPPMHNQLNYNQPIYNRPNHYNPIHQQSSTVPFYPNRPSPSYPYQPYDSFPPSKIIVGCKPHVQPFSDANYLPYSSPKSPSLSQPQEQTTNSYPSYRKDDSSVSASKDLDVDSDENTPKKVSLMDNSISESAPVKESTAKNAKIETPKPVEDPKVTQPAQHETLFKMAQMHNQNISKNKTPTNEKEKNEQAKGAKT